MTQTLSVEGMSCTGCESNVEEAVGDLPGVQGVTADHTEGTVEIEGDTDADLQATIQEAGYEVV